MSNTIREAVMDKAKAGVTEVFLRLQEVSKYIHDGEDLAALGAISGLAGRIQYVETLLTVLRNIESSDPEKN